MNPCLRILFVMDRLNWPRASGSDVHGSQLMRALAARGHRVSLGTFSETTAEAANGLGLETVCDLRTLSPGEAKWLRPANRLQQKFERYWGTDPTKQLTLAAYTHRHDFDAVVILGADALPLFRGVKSRQRVWYAADDAALHHWSRVRFTDRSSWMQVRHAAVHALYEWAFAEWVNRVWVVSDADRRAMRLFTCGLPVDLVRNGVDADYFSPPETRLPEIPFSCTFWGRLDFGPNFDALRWFLEAVWKRIQQPGARFDLFGFRPTPEVVKLCEAAGVSLTADLPDLREEIGRRQVVVLPFVSGRGIKNKLLEAAALGRPILASPQALTGTRGRPPVETARKPSEWIAGLHRLWTDDARRLSLGHRARTWVMEQHSWPAAARVAEAGIMQGFQT